ncbi:hypothetical protein GYA44_01460 [Candidatus Microgenomates bacterium]|nr:hypothetical protein [Candidatus Microgenomates bacterium]
MNNTPKEVKPVEKELQKQPLESNPKQEEKKVVQDPKKESEINTIVGSESGINLIPVLSEQEIKKEDKKKKLNMSAIVSLIILFVISILIVGFNVVFKIQLNVEKEKLVKREQAMSVFSQKILNNNEIMSRIYLYNDIEKGRYSAKDVMEHINNIAIKADCNLLSFSFSGINGMELNGKAQGLEEVAKFWYLLGNDTNIEKISLKSIGKGVQDVSFSFYGSFVLNNFVESSTQ